MIQLMNISSDLKDMLFLERKKNKYNYMIHIQLCTMYMYSIVYIYIYHIFFIHSFIDGHLVFFHVLAVVNSATI